MRLKCDREHRFLNLQSGCFSVSKYINDPAFTFAPYTVSLATANVGFSPSVFNISTTAHSYQTFHLQLVLHHWLMCIPEINYSYALGLMLSYQTQQLIILVLQIILWLLKVKPRSQLSCNYKKSKTIRTSPEVDGSETIESYIMIFRQTLKTSLLAFDINMATFIDFIRSECSPCLSYETSKAEFFQPKLHKTQYPI